MGIGNEHVINTESNYCGHRNDSGSFWLVVL